jgi:Recombination endonuclease VII
MSNDDEGHQDQYAEAPEFGTKELSPATAWWRANRVMLNAKARERYANDAAYREKERARRRKYERVRICRRYGLSVEDFEAMVTAQHGACGICQRPFRSTPCIDHCPLTGWVRGLLCSPCNRGLGHYAHNPAFLAQASVYMQRWAEHLIVCFSTEENNKMSNQDTSDQSQAAKRIREAILKELAQPFGGAAPPPLDRLEAVARALIDKAEERDLEAIKEVFDRAGGRTQSAPALIEAPRLLNVTWQRPPSKPRAKPSTRANAAPLALGAGLCEKSPRSDD